jgi:hypothetical protein
MSQERWDSRDESSELDAVAEFTPFSRLAVLAAVLAIFAVGAVFSPLMVFVAVAGAMVAAAALWSIAHAPRPQLGRQAAIAALMLCVLFGAWGTTWRAVRQQVLYAQAEEQADKWLQLVRTGRLKEGYQLHLSQDSRQAPEADLEEFIQNNREARNEFESFFRGEPLRRIVEAGPQGQVRLVRFEKQMDESFSGQTRDAVSLRYALDYDQDGRPQTAVFLLHLVRSLDGGSAEARWEVRAVETPK